MRALIVSSDGKLEMQEIDMPEISSKQALVKTISCGICGTDATLIRKSFKGFEPADYPMVLGHEGVGEVVSVGDEVKNFEIGDLVLLPFLPEPKQKGKPLHSGWGAFSEYAVVNDMTAYALEEAPETAIAQQVLPAFIDRYEAPVLVTLREVLSSIRYFSIRPGESTVIYGSGPVAMAFAKLLKLSGVDDITAIVRNTQKQELMKQFGVSNCIDSSQTDVLSELRRTHPEGVQYVLDAVGSEQVMNEAITLLRDRGEILCYGVPKQNAMTIDWTGAPYNWKLNFQQFPYKAEEAACHEEIIGWIRDGKLKLADFISEIAAFDDVLEVFDRYLSGRTMKKMIVKFD